MMYLRPDLVHVDRALGKSWETELDAGRAGAAAWIRAGIDKSTPEKGEALFKVTLEGMAAWLKDFVDGKTEVVEPRADREGYTVEALGTRLWYFWAETNQQYMEQFRPRFISPSGHPYRGLKLDSWGNPVKDER